MKVKTVIEKKFGKIKIKKNKYFILILLISQSIINKFIPFSLGVYFSLTKNILFLFLFLLTLFFEVNFTYDDFGNIKIKILRGF